MKTIKSIIKKCMLYSIKMLGSYIGFSWNFC